MISRALKVGPEKEGFNQQDFFEIKKFLLKTCTYLTTIFALLYLIVYTVTEPTLFLLLWFLEKKYGVVLVLNWKGFMILPWYISSFLPAIFVSQKTYKEIASLIEQTMIVIKRGKVFA